MSNYAHYLFLLAVNLSQYKSKVLIIKVFVESLNEVFTPHRFEWCERETKNCDNIFEVCTRTKKFGYIKHFKNQVFTNETHSLLQNAVQMLAILLEKLDQKNLLNNQKEHLKQLVDKQTFELLEKQEELQSQNEEYEALNEELRQTNEELSQLNEELKNAKEKAEKNENKLKEAQSLAHIGSWELDLINNVLEWSDEIYRIFDCSPQDVGATYEAFLDFIHPDDREFVNNSYLNHINSKIPYNIVHRILLASGEIKYVHERCKSDFDKQGKPLCSVGTVADITDKIKSEEKLHRTQYSIDNITDSIFWIDKSAKIVFANQATCRNLEYSMEELLTFKVFDIDPKFPQDKWKDHWNKILLQGSFTIETVHCTKSGRQFPVEITTNKVEFNGIQYNCAIAKDITKRKLTEDVLRLNDSRYRMAQTISMTGNWEYNLQTTHFWGSDEAKRIYGFNLDVDNFTTEEVENCIPERERVHQALIDLIQENKPYNLEFEIHPKNSNESRIISSIAELLRDEQGKPQSVVGVIQDITERKKAEAALLMSEHDLKEAQHLARIGSWDWDAITDQIRWSEVYYRIYGFDPKLSPPGYEEHLKAYTPESAARLNEAVKQNMETGKPYELDLELADSDNPCRWITARSETKRDNKGKIIGLRGTAQDITNRKRAEMRQLVLFNIASSVITTKNINDLFVSIKNELNSILNAKNLFVALYNEKTGKLCSIVDNDEKDKISEWPLEKSLTGYIINQNRPILLQKNDIIRLHEDGIIDLIGTTAEAWLGIPLKIGGKVLGAIVVQSYNNPNAFDKSSIEILEMVAHELTIFIDWQRAEEKSNKLSRAVEQSSVTVVITNKEGYIEYVNPFFSKLTGYSAEEVIGKNPRVLKSGHHPKVFYEELWNTILSGKDWEGEILNKKKDGGLYWEKAIISPIISGDGAVTNFVAIKEDITERKKIVEDLVIAKEKAEESDKLKSAFLANMSHEIRTPMNGILGFAGLLKEPHLSDEQQQKYIQVIEKSGDRMLNIINDIVSISKIESGIMEIHLSETNVNNQMEFVYNTLRLDAERKNLTLSFTNTLPDKEAVITTDSEKLYGILTNLVKNAIKYTDTGTIEFGYEKKGEHLEFFIKDTGIGIPKDRKDAIFERFIQADIEDKMARQGAGLGLTISKAYVEILDGKIWVESEETKGSTFFFTLPCNMAAERKTNTADRTEREAKPITPEISGLKVLIAEDDETSEMLISIGLKKFSREILKASTGKETIESCRKNPDIDLVLMDIQMPDLNGYEATRKIREFDKDVIIIAQTAFALAGDREKAIHAGCNGYIAKPIKKDELLALIQKYFKK